MLTDPNPNPKLYEIIIPVEVELAPADITGVKWLKLSNNEGVVMG